MLNVTNFPISPKQPRRVSLTVARTSYPCALQEAIATGGAHAMHGRELNEIQSPEALADSAFAVSAWWSIREGARRILSRFQTS